MGFKTHPCEHASGLCLLVYSMSQNIFGNDDNNKLALDLHNTVLLKLHEEILSLLLNFKILAIQIIIYSFFHYCTSLFWQGGLSGAEICIHNLLDLTGYIGLHHCRQLCQWTHSPPHAYLPPAIPSFY